MKGQFHAVAREGEEKQTGRRKGRKTILLL
jgi:hypothetical protein